MHNPFLSPENASSQLTQTFVPWEIKNKKLLRVLEEHKSSTKQKASMFSVLYRLKVSPLKLCLLWANTQCYPEKQLTASVQFIPTAFYFSLENSYLCDLIFKCLLLILKVIYLKGKRADEKFEGTTYLFIKYNCIIQF